MAAKTSQKKTSTRRASGLDIKPGPKVVQGPATKKGGKAPSSSKKSATKKAPAKKGPKFIKEVQRKKPTVKGERHVPAAPVMDGAPVTAQEKVTERLEAIKGMEKAPEASQEPKKARGKKTAAKDTAAESESTKGAKVVDLGPVITPKTGGKSYTGKRGRTSQFEGCTLHKLVKENPRKPGTKAHETWEKMEDGITYREFFAMGGRRQDLAWDVAFGRVEVRRDGKRVEVNLKSYTDKAQNAQERAKKREERAQEASKKAAETAPATEAPAEVVPAPKKRAAAKKTASPKKAVSKKATKKAA